MSDITKHPELLAQIHMEVAESALEMDQLWKRVDAAHERAQRLVMGLLERESRGDVISVEECEAWRACSVSAADAFRIYVQHLETLFPEEPHGQPSRN